MTKSVEKVGTELDMLSKEVFSIAKQLVSDHPEEKAKIMELLNQMVASIECDDTDDPEILKAYAFSVGLIASCYGLEDIVMSTRRGS